MRKDDLRHLSKEELEDKLLNLRKQLMELNFQKKVGHVEKPHLFKRTRKDIARVITILMQKSSG